MFTTHHENSGQNYNMKTANESFENMAEFRHLGTIVKN